MKKTRDLINFMVGKVVKHKNGKVTIVLMDMCKTELGRLELVEDFDIDTKRIHNLSLQEYFQSEKCGAKCPAGIHVDRNLGLCKLRTGHKGDHRDGVHRW
jgi:hypothetical protein